MKTNTVIAIIAIGFFSTFWVLALSNLNITITHELKIDDNLENTIEEFNELINSDTFQLIMDAQIQGDNIRLEVNE